MSNLPRISDLSKQVTRAETLMDQREYRMAFMVFSRVVEEAPTSYEAYRALVNLAAIHELGEFWYEAAEAYRRALTLSAHDRNVWVRYADSLRVMMQYERATSAYEYALTLETEAEGKDRTYPPEVLQPVSATAGLYSNKESGLQMAALDLALHFSPTNPFYWYEKGRMLREMGRAEEAIDAFDRALGAIRPDPISTFPQEIWLSRALALMDLHRYNDAVTACDEAMHVDEGNERVWDVRGLALVAGGHGFDAIDSFRRAIDLNPNDRDAWAHLATALRAAGRDVEAEVAERTRDAVRDADAKDDIPF